MRTNTMLNIVTAAAALLAVSPPARALNSETRESVEQKLQSQYTLTKLTADRTNVVTAGAVLTLKKDGLVMVPSDSTLVCANQYKNGKITIGLVSRALCEKGLPGAAGSSRKFVAGEKLNVTRIEIKDKGVVFDLYSADAYSDTYYRAELSFPIEKGSLPSSDELLATTGQVFSVTPADDSKSAKAAPQNPPAPQRQPAPDQAPPPPAADAPPPPPPPDAPPPPPPADNAPPPAATPKTISIGETEDQVVAAYGQPKTIAKPGARKEIYFYQDMKVTFVDGKVSDVQ